jgi:hypothetical protein
MNDVYIWCITGMAGLLALNTLWRLWSERDRLSREDLNDEDRAFAWRVVFFLVFPFLNFLDLRSTIVAIELLGGYVRSWSFGGYWYHLDSAAVPELCALQALFAGAAAQIALATLLLPALLFRPHPFLATVIGYTVSFTFGMNLIVEPIMSVCGLSNPRWLLAYSSGTTEDGIILLAVHIICAAIYVAIMMSQRVRMWFSGLSRPEANDELKKALSEFRSRPESPRLMCRVGLMYDKAGLRRRAKRQLKNLRKQHPEALYSIFLEAILSYRRRDYKASRQTFLKASEFPGVDGPLKASLLAASGCSAFAEGDVIGALNLSERALEFDDACLVARMVKVDVFLRQGKKEQAGEEILFAMRRGLTLDLANKVPLDVDRCFDALAKVEEYAEGRQFVHWN